MYLVLGPLHTHRVQDEAISMFILQILLRSLAPFIAPTLRPAYFQPWKSYSPCVKCHIDAFSLVTRVTAYQQLSSILHVCFLSLVSQNHPLGKALGSSSLCIFFSRSPDVMSVSSVVFSLVYSPLFSGRTNFHLKCQLRYPGELHSGFEIHVWGSVGQSTMID